MDPQHLIDFIDDWLDENAWRTDSRIQDFVLDLRLLITAPAPEENQGTRLEATAA